MLLPAVLLLLLLVVIAALLLLSPPNIYMIALVAFVLESGWVV